MESLIESLLPSSKETLGHHELLSQLTQLAKQFPAKEDIVFVCIGTDQSTGDAFGPLSGTMLQQLGFPHVIGTIAQPCDAYQVEKAVQQLPINKTVIAVDACLGKEKSVGALFMQQAAIQPGSATGRRLPPVGHYSITGVVNQLGPKAYWKIQNTSLNTVLHMVANLRDAVIQAWSLNKEGNND